jgi:hypothetical protein
MDPLTNAGERPRNLNQKGRSEIARRIGREEQLGVRLRKLGWEIEEDCERLAREIKRRLFVAESNHEEMDEDQTGGDAALLETQTNREDGLQLGGSGHCEAQFNKDMNNFDRQTQLQDREHPIAERGAEDCKGGKVLCRSMEDIFNHSRRAARESNWVWIAKPIALGGEEFPARPDEIRRDGGRAKRLFRIHPPPSTRKPYAAVVTTVTAATTAAAISAATTTTAAKRVKTAEMSRDFESSGPRRRYEEDRLGGRYFPESSGWRRGGEGDLRRELELRDRMFRERDMSGSGYRSYRDGEAEDRRRNFDSRSLGQGNRGGV